MKAQQSGFTLIELIVVIVLLGILGVTAAAKYQSLSADAADAVENAVASELASGASINYAKSLVGTAAVTVSGTVACATVGGNLLEQGTPADVTIADGADVACSGAGDTVQCSVTHSKGTAGSATATLICTG